jgi:hypothetical protein
MPTILSPRKAPQPISASFTIEAMRNALPHARMLAQHLYTATEQVPGDPVILAAAADALARVNAELSIGQRSDALAAAARAAGEVA